ncbi:MAG: glutamine-hydrolyzing GMP synthase [Candidatus Lambdaproteobacteria bacterium]|nr:glutamine-hydrolyzing GMP synthase [Candidatus Lambdaproteobacteria bacterium]
MSHDYIAILDFGGQYAHLIAKRIRHLGIYTRIFSPMASAAELTAAKGVILSGGPQSVFGEQAVPFNDEILQLDKPILGLCYGHQLLAQRLGGTVRNMGRGEYGKTTLRLDEGPASPLLAGVDGEQSVWMSHGDTVVAPPPEFLTLAHTALCPVAVMQHASRPLFGLQFHPEVTDTPCGRQVLANFARLTGAAGGWSMAQYMREAIEDCRAQVGARSVLMFLSGGVDSTVAFALLVRALGQARVRGLLIDTGFLRKHEAAEIMARYAQLGWHNVDLHDASEVFLQSVQGLVEPQAKRQAIGETFLRVRDDFLARMALDPAQWLLGQGTLYPDIIESGGTAHADVIKFHHNRVQGIAEMIAAGLVVEPLKELYKDEVRALGAELGLPEDIVWRHPFPGPGLAINVLCSAGEAPPAAAAGEPALDEVLAGTGYAGRRLAVRSVGVQGDQRTYTTPAAIVGPRDWAALEATSIRLTNEIRSLNRVVTLLAPQALPTLRPRRAYCTKDRLDLLREADAVATRTLRAHGLMRIIFQLLVILLPLSANGDGECLVLRPVVSEDVMTAQFARIDWSILNPLADELLRLPGIHAVFYDVTHKPPATFGWE